MSPPTRVNIMVGATHDEVVLLRRRYPQFRQHLALTPRSELGGFRFKVGEYVWTPNALSLPAAVRLQLRGALAPMLDEQSVEETFPATLLLW